MTWKNRLRKAKYTAPDGEDISFLYENVSRNRNKQTAQYYFPDAKGTMVLDMGSSSKIFPVQAIFIGDNCDLEADLFEALIFQQGIGKLQHPLYGLVDVVPSGNVVRKDDLKTGANQSIACSFGEQSVSNKCPRCRRA